MTKTPVEDGAWGVNGEGNIYYDPESVGMEIVGTVDASEAFEFEILLVVRDLEDGKLYIATDAGCSCPVPFEDVRGRSDMRRIDSIADFDAEAGSYLSGFYDSYASEVRELRNKVFDLLWSE